MSISFNVLSYLLNMKGGGLRVYKTPLISQERNLSLTGVNMRSFGALGVALHASLLVLLLAQDIHKARDGVQRRSQRRLPLTDRSTGHHLPTYMVHLYRNFMSNMSRPEDAMEQDAEKQADTVRSVMAKGNLLSKNA